MKQKSVNRRASKITREINWLPACNSSRSGRRAWAEPEIWFRIVHVALDVRDANSVATYREQTVEIALGPKGAFENGTIGHLTRCVPADKVVAAVPPRRSKPKLSKKPRTPRVVELLRKAIEWQALIESGEVRNHAEIARREGLTRARVTQIMGMHRLAPEIQNHILAMPDMVRRSAITERALRPIAKVEDHRKQIGVFGTLLRDDFLSSGPHTLQPNPI